MRTFTLINNNGTTYDVTSPGSAFFYNVDGLGYERIMDFNQVGDIFGLMKDKASQNTISGTVKFWKGTAEKDYFDFYKFCKTAPLKLQYNPGHGVYTRNGYVKKITKTDGLDDAMTVKIDFICTSPWYKTIQQYNNGDASDGKVYNYQYDYVYTDSTPGSLLIDSDSFMECPCKLIIYGPVTNPVWRHYINGELVTTGKINATVPVNRQIHVDTTNIPWSIKQYDNLGNFVSDLYQLSDFSTERFVQLGNGRNDITVVDDGVNPVGVGLEAQIEYDTI